ncbi:macrolide ABC transporter ATP-binding protein [Rossellomorea marisflavi]|uniref:ABC transporter ATP-binding protein n=1 Tax=Rossellomorea marisflavi TaxID=189381 RepID=UPI0025CB4AF5|nr:ABC transporter ATP-binding protein [Rossellomorea marisflavi]GLI86201.1 macrolide ABC transporter ATP-binding protein [Rossellomorea marisflavi]
MTILQINHLEKVYGQGSNAFHALKDLTMNVEKGEFLAIMGTSGSGKSTLLNMMAGLDQPTRGTIHLNGQPVHSLRDGALTELRRDHIGFIFQFFNLIPVLTVLENVTLPSDLASKRKGIKKRAMDLLDHLGISHLAGSFPSELSGGQQQRVAIARALVTEPKIILADEPTGSLDSKTGKEILQLLRTFTEELGHTLIMVTHDAQVAAHSHRVIFLRDGALIKDTQLAANHSIMEKTSLLNQEFERFSQ